MAGITFAVHGCSKFQMGLGNVAGWFESIGIPGVLAWLPCWNWSAALP
jgi:putative oxidoreductase